MTTLRHKPSFTEWVALVRSLEERRWEDDGIVGKILVSDEKQVQLLANIFANLSHDNADIPCQVLSGDPDDLAIGREYLLGLGRPRLGFGYLFQDTDEWLRNQDVAYGVLDNWYIANDNWFADDTSQPCAEAYRAVSGFVGVLEKSAAVVDRSNGTLIFLPGERFDLPIRYDLATLQQLDSTALKELSALAQTADGHTKQRLEILGRAIYDLCKDLPVKKRFAHLLAHAPDLLQRFKDGYSLFASSFSFEKVRGQMEALRVDYTTRIHKALSDIQSQLLGIPISTIVVATQLKDVEAPGALMWGNIAVLLGAFVFVGLLGLAIRNQFHTLDVLALELKRQEDETKREQPELAAGFEPIFSGLNSRIWHQRIVLGAIGALGVVGLILAFIMFWTMTKPALSIFI